MPCLLDIVTFRRRHSVGTASLPCNRRYTPPSRRYTPPSRRYTPSSVPPSLLLHAATAMLSHRGASLWLVRRTDITVLLP
ncbi:MAG: hypothetical protein PUH57_01355 [Prevotellaceae bacterium]|nr:hypothetical protein [Prevotellaceae bacterium]MDY2750601.1 hypothetical protein [Prevotella sp.]